MSPTVEVGAEWNVSGSRDTCITSAKRVSAQNPGPCGMPSSGGGTGSSWNDTGRSARSLAKIPSRSGRIHCSISPSRIVVEREIGGGEIGAGRSVRHAASLDLEG